MAVELSSALAFIALYVVLSACYTWRIVARLKVGFARFVSYLPILLFNVLLPFLLETHGIYTFARVSCAYHVSWLASYKALALCLNRGSLANQEQYGFAHFFALYLLHIIPAKEQLKGVAKLKEALLLFFRTVFKAAGLMVCYIFLSPDIYDFSYLNTFVCGFAVFFFASFFADFSSWTALVFFGVTSIDGFDYPFFATSVRNLWGSRWNVTTGKVLRSLSYDIIMDGTLVRENAVGDGKRVSELRRSIALFAIFGLSTVAHLMMSWLGHGEFSLAIVYYFMLQPFLLIGEHMLANLFSRSVHASLPSWLFIPIVFHLNLFIGHRTFIVSQLEEGAKDDAFELRDTVLQAIGF